MLRVAGVAAGPSSTGPILSRKCACGGPASAMTSDCEGCAKKRLSRRRSGDAELGEVPGSVDDVLRQPGRALEPATRRDMEARFGHSFARVRLHDDAAAAASARAVRARAYSVGDHVVFASGEYAPATRSGRALLAHELAHVTQQTPSARDSATSPRLPTPSEERSIERDADHRADRALAGGGTTPAPTRAPGVVHRQAAGAAPAPSPPQPQPADPCRHAASVSQNSLGRAPGARFDARLDRSACPVCALALDMRVFFNFSNAVQPWPDQSTKNDYRDEFVRIVQEQWSHEYDFIPPANGCAGEGCQRVTVGLNVIPVAASQNPHWTVNVTYTDHFIRSSVSSTTHTGTFDSRDITHETGDQYPVAHEAGHMLGFGHTNCGLNGPFTGNINADSCYGPDDIMGGGSSTTVDEYAVFKETLTQLAPGCGWLPAVTNARRRRNRIIGGVVGGLLGGLAGAAAGFGIGFGIGKMFGGLGGLIGGIIGGIVGGIAGAVGGATVGSGIGDRSRRQGEA